MDVFHLAEEGKIQRLFLARYKPNYEGAISHITQRAAGESPLFLEEADYLYMLHLIKESTGKFNLDVFCFVLMPNHVHLLLRQNEKNLPEAMQGIFARYATYVNVKYQRKGHLFCGRYRMALCFDDSYLLTASLYIHLNPVRAGLCGNSTDYRWSTASLYLSSVSRRTFVNFSFILKTLDPSEDKARIIYRECLQRASEINPDNVLEDTRGLEKFRTKVAPKLRDIVNYNVISFLPADDEIVEELKALQAKGRLRRPEELQARKFLVAQLRARGYKANQIAEMTSLTKWAIYAILNYKNRSDAIL